MPDTEQVRTALRDRWHLSADHISARPDGVLSRSWSVTAGTGDYVVRFADAASRRSMEAGLAAADHLAGWGIAVGTPMRTLSGERTATVDGGALAVLRRVPGRPLAGTDPLDQQWWGDRLGSVHRALQHFQHPGLRPWNLIDADAPHLDARPWLRPAVTAAATAATRLTVTDRLTYGVLHGDPAPGGFVMDAGTGRTGLLDCGASGTGPLLCDLAAAVVYAGGPDAAGEMLDGYVAAGPVHRDEIEAGLPVLVRFRWAVQADFAARRLGTSPDAAGELDAAGAALESLPG